MRLLAVLGSQGIVIKCTAAIFFRKVGRITHPVTMAIGSLIVEYETARLFTNLNLLQYLE